MAVNNAQVNVGTAVVGLWVADTDGKPGESLLVQNLGAATVYMGGAEVSSSTGVALAPGGAVQVELIAGAGPIYARTASGSADVRLLAVGV